MLIFSLHTFFLFLSLGLTYLWTKNPSLSPFNLQATGLLILFYFVTKFVTGKAKGAQNTLDAIIFTTITFLIVTTTGGVHSPVFFLLYFLLFALSLLFEPIQSIILSLLLIALFGYDLSNNFDNLALINLITLFLTTPIAMIFGKKYLQTLEDLGRIKQLNQIISEEETDTLLWLTTRARPTLISLLDTTSLIISSNLLPTRLQNRLKQLHQDLISLHQSAQTLENDIQDIDEKSD
ncbi:hypothetical protein HYU90_03135 [Candidatus Collierbacteria bacterium]|nr:hypothetical protein [Candidatus Collierbacteria bacterium]